MVGQVVRQVGGVGDVARTSRTDHAYVTVYYIRSVMPTIDSMDVRDGVGRMASAIGPEASNYRYHCCRTSATE